MHQTDQGDDELKVVANTKTVFRMQINYVDYYICRATDYDPALWGKGHDGSQRTGFIPRVPVIRIFGCTETRQRVCAHVHGVLPYIYVEYTGSLDESSVDSYILKFREATDKALEQSYEQPTNNARLTVGSKYVAFISLVKGIPFYGYHVGYTYYLKIYLLNPIWVPRLSELLLRGAVLNRVFQPYETHIQYILQFLCNFNLYGCTFLECSQVRFREPVPDYALLSQWERKVCKWNSQVIPPAWVVSNGSIKRQSYCSLEVDILASDIVNRLAVKERKLHHTFNEGVSKFSMDGTKLVQSLESLWQEERQRRQLRHGKSTSLDEWTAEITAPFSTESRSTEDTQWIHEDELWNQVNEIIGRESGGDMGNRTLENFLEVDKQVERIRTAFESITDLFSENLTRSLMNSSQASYCVESDISSSFSFTVDEKWMQDETNIDKEVSNEFTITEEDLLEASSDEEREETFEHVEGSISFDNSRIELHKQGLRKSVDVEGLGENRKRKFSRVNGMENGSTWEASSQGQGWNCEVDMTNLEGLRRQNDGSLWEVKTPIDKVGGENNVGKWCSGEKTHESWQGDITPGSKEKQGVEMISSSIILEDICSTGRELVSSANASKSEGIEDVFYTKKAQQSQILSRVVREEFGIRGGHVEYIFGEGPPEDDMVMGTFSDWGLPEVEYQEAFYGDVKDVPRKGREYGGRVHRVLGNGYEYLGEFCTTEYCGIGTDGQVTSRLEKEAKCRLGCPRVEWEYSLEAPSVEEVDDWLAGGGNEGERIGQWGETVGGIMMDGSQVICPSGYDKGRFLYSRGGKKGLAVQQSQYMQIFSVEVFAHSRGDQVPDAEKDGIRGIFWAVEREAFDDDDDESEETKAWEVMGNRRILQGVIMVSEDERLSRTIERLMGRTRRRVDIENCEVEAINRLIDIVRLYDPDILTGYEVCSRSWGYIMKRGEKAFDWNISREISCLRDFNEDFMGKERNARGKKIVGRHLLNIWRIVRNEVNLTDFSIENVGFQILNKRIAKYSERDLNDWMDSRGWKKIEIVMKYFMERSRMNLDILDGNGVITRYSEQARIVGIDFLSALNRGSQYKVESLMFRIAIPESYILVSPSRKQVGRQNAMESLPLIMEPISGFYTSPVIVLDFQSLYPSIMIAYNYCYSTCVGRIVGWRGENKLGFKEYNRQEGIIKLHGEQNGIRVSPNGLMFVKEKVREGLLGRLLKEILETRVMVKNSMKEMNEEEERGLRRILDNRQLALKLICNVTYGYTSASFSGRMPCVEIADSIVQSGRETLERALALIHSVKRWRAEVVYGDTDSLFVVVRNRSRDEAFRIGREIAEAVTRINPRPVKLKFEKVYHPSILLTKKRYVGMKYERMEQREGEFEAKGIETVRRDGVPAIRKLEEVMIKELFRSKDISKCKKIFQQECEKIYGGRISVQDFIFAREVKPGRYINIETGEYHENFQREKSRGNVPGGVEVIRQNMVNDGKNVAQEGERVPYVVIRGEPGSRLNERCVSVERVVKVTGMEIDGDYYIWRVIRPPLDRIFGLVGVDVGMWINEIPRRRGMMGQFEGRYTGRGKGMVSKKIEQFMIKLYCRVCSGRIEDLGNKRDNHQVCEVCWERREFTFGRVYGKLMDRKKRVEGIEEVCRRCETRELEGGNGEQKMESCCINQGCWYFYYRERQKRKLEMQEQVYGGIISRLIEDEW